MSDGGCGLFQALEGAVYGGLEIHVVLPYGRERHMERERLGERW